HPERRMVLGLVDRLEHDQPRVLDGHEVLGMDEIGETAFEAMKSRYNVVELITAVKPYFIDHFFKQRDADRVIYLDADMMVFDRQAPRPERRALASARAAADTGRRVPLPGQRQRAAGVLPFQQLQLR